MRPSSSAQAFPLDVQEAEEAFDLALISSLEIDVVPHLGGSKLPDEVVSQLGKVLQRGSQVYESAPGSSIGRSESPEEKNGKSPDYNNGFKESEFVGTTDSRTLTPREKFSYRCFELLFLICSDTTKGFFTRLPAL
jgi:hypothetical protein